MGRPNLSRETKFSGANGTREITIFPVQLTASKIDKYLIDSYLLYVMAIHTYIHTYIHTHIHTYIHTYIHFS